MTRMSAKTEKPPTLEELTKPQPESDDPEYLAWVKAKVENARRSAENRDNLIPAEQVWKRLGLED